MSQKIVVDRNALSLWKGDNARICWGLCGFARLLGIR
jgi:hypothetical protein